MEKVKRITNTIYFELFKITIIIIVILIAIPYTESLIRSYNIDSFIIKHKFIGSIVYICIKILATVLVIIPVEIISIPVNRILGFWNAIILSTISLVIGGSLNYYIGMKHGTMLVGKFIGVNTATKITKFSKKISGQKTFHIFLLFFAMGGKYASYVVGVSQKNYFQYLYTLFPGGLFISSLAIQRDINVYNNNTQAMIYLVVGGLSQAIASYLLIGKEVLKPLKRLLISVRSN